MFKDKPRIQSNSGKLTNWLTTGTSDQPLVINEDATEPIVIREEEDSVPINLADIPEASVPEEQSRRSTRKKSTRVDQAVDSLSDNDGLDLFVPKPSPGELKDKTSKSGEAENGDDEPSEGDKKKAGLKTSYDGFSIYGRILCLVVKRRGVRHPAGASGATSSQAMLENWVSTQAMAEPLDDEEDAV